MSFDYGPITSTAAALIEQFGRAAVLSVPGPSSGTPYNPTPGTPTDYPVNIVETDIKTFIERGSAVQRGDVAILMSATPVSPTASDSVVIDSNRWRVVEAFPISPGGTLVASTLLLRR